MDAKEYTVTFRHRILLDGRVAFWQTGGEVIRLIFADENGHLID